ncbi:MAG TPA: hypothetical protein VM695_11370 [Phycisphaerae bacterium]|nr:hypothetical protein [Phycisphaerae bacterium]
MRTRTLLVLASLAGGALAGGCTQKVDITILNHTDVSRTVQLSVPDETVTLGAVGPNGRLSSTLAVKKSDLPASCRLSAGAGAQQSFTVTEDSPSKWWFHVTASGQLAGPYGKDDVHVETEDRGTIDVPVGRRMKLK